MIEFVPENSLRGIIPSHILTLTFSGDCGTQQDVKKNTLSYYMAASAL